MRCLSSSRARGLVIGLVLMLSSTLPVRAADSVSRPEVFQVLTNLVEIRRQASSGRPVVRPVQLEGVVCWVDSPKGMLVLQTASGAMNLDLGSNAPPVRPGQKIRVEGDFMIDRTGLETRILPLVDNDGLHAMVQQSGKRFLKPGRHPLRVTWFNALGEYGLEVSYEGPGISPRLIPTSALFREQTDSPGGTTNFVNGLNYRYYEGSWSRLPNFDRLVPAKAGVVANFDLTAKKRKDNIGFEFTGFLDVQTEGLYTLFTRSDDGSRLFIGEPSLRLEVTGADALPRPHPITPGQTLGNEESFWAEGGRDGYVCGGPAGGHGTGTVSRVGPHARNGGR